MMAVGLKAGLGKEHKKAVTYARVRSGQGSIEDIAQVKQNILEQHQDKQEAYSKSINIQNMINQYSPNLTAIQQGELVSAYGKSFSKDQREEATQTLTRRTEINTRLSDNKEDSTEALLLKEIAGGIDRLVTITTAK